MEHRKVLRISTIVLAMAIFSLAIAKPAVAYAHSHLNLGGLSDIGDYLNVHPCAHGHHLCGLLGIAGGLIGTAHAGPLGSIAGKWAGDKADELIKQHYHEEEDGGGSSHEDHGSSDNSGSSDHDHSDSSSDHDFSPSGGGNGGSNSLPSEGSGGGGGGSDNGGGGDSGGGDSGGDSGGGGGDDN